MKKLLKSINSNLVNAYANEGGTNRQCTINNCSTTNKSCRC